MALIASRQQHGIALVLSMVILVMMLMLALPFALSQNASIQSSDQFAISQDTSNARESVEALGLGLSANTFSRTWTDPDNVLHHALFDDSKNIIDPSTSLDLGNTRIESVSYPLRVYYDLEKIRETVWAQLDETNLDFELIIEDESGKIDLNALNQAQWIALLNSVGVTYQSGQLASGFIYYRYQVLNGKPITALEQLMVANPIGGSPSRPPLTHAELDRIRPYVTAHGMGQGKDGHQELGNAIIATNPNPPNNKYSAIDIHPSEHITANNTFKVYGEDPDFWTSVNSVTEPFTVISTPIAQALNINTASFKVLDLINIKDTTPLVSGLDRVVFKEPGDLPDELKDRISMIDDKDTPETSDDLEQFPIALNSSGVATIKTRAQSYNRANKPASESAREIIALTLTGKDQLEKKWNDQLAMQLNIATRLSSMIASWPRAIERRDDNKKPIGNNWKDLKADPTDITNARMKPKPLPDIHDMDIFPDGGWTKLFDHFDEDIPAGFDIEDDVNPEGITSTNTAGTSLVYDHEETVDGKKTSFAEPHFVAGGNPQQMEARQFSFWLTTPNKADFDANWVDRTIPIFELRAPEQNTGAPIDPSGPNNGHSVWDVLLADGRTMDYRKTNGDNGKQHYLAMYYDGTTDLEHFVLSVAGEIIEIPAAVFGAPFNPQNHFSMADQDIDDRTLGGGTHPLSNPQRMTWSEHRYIHKLVPDRAYNVQVIMQNSKPGGLHIIIDGLVGRDLTKLDNYNISEILPGDHYTTPYPLQLTGALPSITQSMTPGNTIADDALREVGNIRARGLNLPAPWDGILASPSDWLPDNTNGLAHGMMNINGEFIAYKNWSSSGGIYTFQNCKRGARQLVNDQDEIGKSYTHRGYTFTIPPESGLSADSYRRNMPAHPNRSEVWPGGLSFERDTTLYRGGCVLMTPMGDNTRITGTTDQPISGADEIPIISIADASLFPEQGIIRVRGRSAFDNYPPADPTRTYDHDGDGATATPTPELPMVAGDGVNEDIIEIMYYKKSGNNLEILQRGLFGTNPQNPPPPDPTPGPRMDFVVPDPANTGDHIKILLVSWQVETDPTEPGRYKNPGAGVPNELTPGYEASAGGVPGAATPIDPATGRYDAPPASTNSRWIPESRLQLYDVTNTSPLTYGAIEWIDYTDVEKIDASISATGATEYYFLQRNGGYGSGRGQLGTHYDPARVWPVGTRILPVQTAGKFGYLMEAGDVVTLSAKQLGAANVNYRDAGGVQSRQFSTWQTVIRYASHNTHDYFTWVDTGAGWGPSFHYPKDIKFAFTEELPEFPTNAMVSIWPSWSNEDLTLYKISSISPNQFNATNFPFVNAWADNYNDKDSRKIHIGTQDVSRFPTDPMWVNNMPGVINNAQCIFDSISSIKPLSGKNHQIPMVVSASSGTDIGDSIRITNGDGFSGNLRDRTGLVVIEGEVLAYEISNPPAGSELDLLIIGNSLLGSKRATDIGVGSEVLRLPIGPVARLADALPANHTDIVDLVDISGIGNDTSILNKAHSFMIVDPQDGSHKHEMVQLIPEAGRYHTAPWLRGMYNTPVQSWDSDDLVIAWTPRYASALPKDIAHLTDEKLQSSLLRSRCYAWIGAPLRIFGLKMLGTASDPSAEVLLRHNPDVPFDFEVRALDQGYNWASTDTLFMQTPAASATDGVALELPPEFSQTWEPEGGDFEMRVHWRYTTDAYDPSDEVYEQIQAIAAAANTAPSIQSVSLKANSKIHILDSTAQK